MQQRCVSIQRMQDSCCQNSVTCWSTVIETCDERGILPRDGRVSLIATYAAV